MEHMQHVVLSSQPVGERAVAAVPAILLLLSREDARALGCLPGEAILGFLVEDGAAEQFQPNSGFIAFLYDTIRRVLPLGPGFRRAAAEQGEGWLYVSVRVMGCSSLRRRHEISLASKDAAMITGS
jgi:hypothetical protein